MSGHLTSRTAFILCLLIVAGFSATAINATIDQTTIDKIVTAIKPNIPVPLEMHGTEYFLGEQATPFLQLKDQQGNWVLNGSCKLDIFYPNKTQAVDNAPMLYIPNSDGLYFYTYTPPVTGLYPMSAECIYSNIIRWYYTTPGYNPFSQYGMDCGTELLNMTTYQGTTAPTSPIVLNTPTDWQYVQTASGGGGTKLVNATFKFNASKGSCRVNKTLEPTLNIFFMGEASTQATLQIYAWNWNTSVWNIIGNKTQVGLATSSATSGATDFISVEVNSANYTANDGTVLLMGYAYSGTTFTEWWDWFAIETIGNGTATIDLKGSGELHVSAPAWTAEQNATLYDTNAKVTQVNSTLNLSVEPKLDSIIGTLSTLVADVWAYSTRTLTSFGTLVSDIWGAGTRELTGFSFKVVTSGGNITNVTSPVFCANCTSINASELWSYENRTLTQAVGESNLTAGDVWTYATRNLTQYGTASNLTAAEIWTYSTRELTSALQNVSASDVWSYSNRTLTSLTSINGSVTCEPFICQWVNDLRGRSELVCSKFGG